MESSELDIKSYLRLAYKKRYVFAIAVFLIVTASVAACYLMPAVYEAKSTVFIERNVIENLIKDIAITPSMEERLEVLAYTLKSRSLLLKVIDELGIEVDRNDQAEMDKLIGGLQKNTEIATDIKRHNTEMNLFIVSFEDRDPAFARDYVNTLVRCYIEGNLSEKREEAYGANRFLGEQIKYFKEKLDGAEAEIVNFRKDKGIFVAVDEGMVVQEIKTHKEKLEELKIQKMELQARRGLIKKQIKEESPYTVAMFGRSSDDPKTRLLFLKKNLNELLMKYTENYPEVIRVRAEIELLEKQLGDKKTLQETRTADAEESQRAETEMSTLNPLYQRLKEELATTGLELAALEARQKHLGQLIETKEAYLRDIPSEKKKLLDMEREKNTFRKIYEDLVHRLGQSEVSKQMEVQDKASTFRVVDPAVLPTKPVSPNRLKIMLMGLFGGLAGGLGTVFGFDYMDKSVKNVDSLRSLGVPVLAMIPHIQEPDEVKKRKRKDILLYGFSALYMMCILGIMAMEKLGLVP